MLLNISAFHSVVIAELKATASRVSLGINIFKDCFGQHERRCELASETELIAALSTIFTVADPKLIVGIGDDGAVIKASTQNLVAATDMAVEGVHFNRRWSNLHDIGAKIAAANLADIFAMGGDPRYLLVSAGLTKDFGIAEIQELAQGIKSEADLVGAAIIGGDISRAEQLVISITALGEVENPIKRAGAKVGDAVIISGLPGKSALGLHQLGKGESNSPYIRAHLKPEVNYQLARKFRNVSAMCDVSDGLLSELNHIATSSEVGIEVDVKAIESIPGFPELSAAAGSNIWEFVLTGGEDHIFVATTSGEIPVGAYTIGRVVAGSEVKVPGIANFSGKGFRHF